MSVVTYGSSGSSASVMEGLYSVSPEFYENKRNYLEKSRDEYNSLYKKYKCHLDTIAVSCSGVALFGIIIIFLKFKEKEVLLSIIKFIRPLISLISLGGGGCISILEF